MNGPSTDRLHVALVGAGGRISGDWLVALGSSPDLIVTDLVEADRTRHEALHERVPRARLHDDLDALLASPPDLAIVATPPVHHRSQATALLEAGSHVLCEKPLAPSVDDAQAMLAVAARTGRRLTMASKFRYVADVVEARARIAAGAIGRPCSYDNGFCSRVAMRGRWNADPAVSGGGVLADNGPHAADLARVLLGEIRAIRGAVPLGPALQDLPVEDGVRVLFETRSDVAGITELSWSVHSGRRDYARLVGEDGVLELRWDGATLRRGDVVDEFGKGYDKRAAFRAQLDDLVEALRDGRSPAITDQDALDSVRFVAAGYRSLREGRRVALDPDEQGSR